MLQRPNPSEYLTYYDKYIQPLPDSGLLSYMSQQSESFIKFIESLNSDQLTLKYAPEKWTIKEVITHVNDIERIFAYRLLAIVRGEKKPMPGFNENEYISDANVANRTKENLIKEFSALRISNFALFESIENEDWLRQGQMSGSNTSVRAIAYIMVGHVDHHTNILKERYLK